MKLITRAIILVFVCVSVALPSTQAGDKAKIVSKANAAYYNLRTAGLKGFQCNISVSWDRGAANFPASDPFSTETGRRAMSAIKFPLTVGMNGNFKLDIPPVVPTGNEKLDKRLNDSPIFINQMMGNFFQAWRQFVSGTFLPGPDVDYAVQESPENYRITYKEKTADVEVQLTKELEVSQLSLSGANFKIIIHPKFIKTAKGLLISGIESDATDPSNVQIHVEMNIKYQNVDGFALPVKLALDATTNSRTTSFDVGFSDFQVVR